MSHTLTDIFGDVDVDPPSTSTTNTQANHNNSEDPSDIPRLRSVHVTAGYRDGIAASKGASVQGGFDEGFALGAAVGRRVGFVVGVLEGMGRGVVGAGVGVGVGGREISGRGDREGGRGREGKGDRDREGRGEHDGDRDGDRRGGMLEEVRGLRRRAREELLVGRVFSREYFDEDGLWAYEVEGWDRGDDDDDVTVEMVAAAHPLIKSWEARIAQLAERLGANLAALDDGYL